MTENEIGGPVVFLGSCDERVEYRTCVRRDDKTVHLQIRGSADVLDRLVPVPEPDDMDEQMCDDWTDWKEV